MIPFEEAYVTTSSVKRDAYILFIESNTFLAPLTFNSVEKIPLKETSGEEGNTTEDLTDTHASVKPDILVYAERISSITCSSKSVLSKDFVTASSSGFLPFSKRC